MMEKKSSLYQRAVSKVRRTPASVHSLASSSSHYSSQNSLVPPEGGRQSVIDGQPEPTTAAAPSNTVFASTSASQATCMQVALDRLSLRNGVDFLNITSAYNGLTDPKEFDRVFSKMSGKLDSRPASKSKLGAFSARVKSILPTLGAAKAFTMTLARIDPNSVAPLVCAGVFFALELVLLQLTPDQLETILDIMVDSFVMLKRWGFYEQHSLTIPDPIVQSKRANLHQKLPELYMEILTLTAAIYGHVEGRWWEKAKDHLTSKCIEFKTRFRDIERTSKQCESIKAELEMLLKQQGDYDKILKWVLPMASTKSNDEVLSETGVDNTYQSCGKWLLESQTYQSWLSRTGGVAKSTSGVPSVIWLTGTVGTGKTTLMCRVIVSLLALRLENSKNDGGRSRRVLYHYCSASNAEDLRPRWESILRNLIFQLAWNNDWTVANAAQDAYYRYQRGLNRDYMTSVAAWEGLFTAIVEDNKSPDDVVILVDGLDECESIERNKMLKFFKKLVSDKPDLRLMLSSQEHVNVDTYFVTNQLTTIRTSPTNTKQDMETFIETEIRKQQDEESNRRSIIYKTSKLQERLKKALIGRAQGMFQWVKIWIGIFYPPDPIELSKDAEAELDSLECLNSATQTNDDRWKRLYDAYRRLYLADSQRKEQHKFKARAIRFLLSSYDLITVSELVEAVTADGDDRTREEVTAEFLESRCRNFLIFDRSNSDSGNVKFAHESVRIFFISSRSEASGTKNHIGDFSDLACHLEMTQLCFEAMKRKNHWLWGSSGIDLKAVEQQWSLRAQSIELTNKIVQIARDKTQPDEKLSALLDIAEVSEWVSHRGFAYYLGTHWLSHWKSLLDVKPNSSELHGLYSCWEDILWGQESAFASWAVFLCRFRFDSRIFPGLETLDRCRIVEEMQDCVGIAGDMLVPIRTFAFFLFDLFPVSETSMPSGNKRSQADEDANQRRHLLETGVQVIRREFYFRNENGETLLHIAVRTGNRSLAEALLRIEKRYILGSGRVNEAIMFSSKLLEMTDCYGHTALCRAARNGDCGMLTTIIDSCSDFDTATFVNQSDTNSRTPLIEAAEGGHLEAVKLLAGVEGADLAAEDNSGDTALDRAAIARHKDVVQWLIAHSKLDPTRMSASVARLLERAIQSKHRGMFDMLFDNEGLDFKSGPCATILSYAIKHHAMDIAEKILKSGRVEVNREDEDGRTLLSHMAELNRVDSVELLLRAAGCEVNSEDNRGRTPLWWTTINLLRPADAARVLLEAPGIDPNIADFDGDTPLEFAERTSPGPENDELLKLLRSRVGTRPPGRYGLNRV